MSRENALTLALQVLAWLAASDELLPVFLGASGAAPADLAARAVDEEFLAAVLDFLLLDDAWVIAFCAAGGHAPEDPARAQAVLAGPAGAHWT